MLKSAAVTLSLFAALSAANVASAQGFIPYPYVRQPIVRPVVVVPIGKSVVPPGYAYPQTYPTYSPPIPSYYPAPVHLNRRDLERHIENVLRSHFGHCVDDVDVEVDFRHREVEVEIEFRHGVPDAHARIRHLLASMPQLAGYRIRLDVDFD